jgi:hypothetical protein
MKQIILGALALLCLAACSYKVYPVDALVDNYKQAMQTPEELAAKENVAVFLSDQEVPGPYKLIAFVENPVPASGDILKKAVLKADELGGNAIIVQSARSFKVIELVGRPVRRPAPPRDVQSQPGPAPAPRVAPAPRQPAPAREPRAEGESLIDKVKGSSIFQKDESKAEARAEARAAREEAARTRAAEAEAARAKAAADRAAKAEADRIAREEAAAGRAAKAEADRLAREEAAAGRAAKAEADRLAREEAARTRAAEAEAARAKAAADKAAKAESDRYAREEAARAKAAADLFAREEAARAEAEAAKARAAAEKAAAEKAAAAQAAPAAPLTKSPVFDDSTLQWFTSGYVYRAKEEEQVEIIDAMNYEIRENLKVCKTQAEADFIAGKINQLEKYNNALPIPSGTQASKIKGYRNMLKKLAAKFTPEQQGVAGKVDGAVHSVKDFIQNLGNK